MAQDLAKKAGDSFVPAERILQALAMAAGAATAKRASIHSTAVYANVVVSTRFKPMDHEQQRQFRFGQHYTAPMAVR